MATNTEDRGSRKTREGIVVSDKMDKTITVEVSNRVSRYVLKGHEPHTQAQST